MSKNILNHLLRRNITLGQTIGYILSLFLGLVIVIAGISFIADIHHATSAKSSQNGSLESYAVVTKQMDGILFPEPSTTYFTTDEIDDLSRQPGVEAVGRFSRADFDVNIRLSPQFGGLSSALFLEAVDDDFIDIDLRRFKFDPADPGDVPIVIPVEYLSLYNFGFAPTRGLPRLTPEMLALIPVEMSVSGNGLQKTFNTRVVGCSERLNTIAVPQAFLDYANSLFGRGDNPGVSRLIVKTSPGYDLASYLDANHLTTSTGVITDQRIYRLAMILTGAVTLIGLLIMLLSIALLSLSLNLLLFKNRTVLHNLMLLGYTPATLSLAYLRRTALLNGIIAALALIMVLILRYMWTATIRSVGLQVDPSCSILYCICIILWMIITAINAATIMRNVKVAFRC